VRGKGGGGNSRKKEKTGGKTASIFRVAVRRGKGKNSWIMCQWPSSHNLHRNQDGKGERRGIGSTKVDSTMPPRRKRTPGGKGEKGKRCAIF